MFLVEVGQWYYPQKHYTMFCWFAKTYNFGLKLCDSSILKKELKEIQPPQWHFLHIQIVKYYSWQHYQPNKTKPCFHKKKKRANKRASRPLWYHCHSPTNCVQIKGHRGHIMTWNLGSLFSHHPWHQRSST